MSDGIKINKLEFNSSALNHGLSIFQENMNSKFKRDEERICNEILKNAQDMCPVDTGELKSSGYVRKTDRGYEVGFSAPYASIVHEKPDGWQKSGETQFLSKAIGLVCGENYERLKRELMSFD